MLSSLILKTVLEQVSHAIVICDKDGNYILWNNTAQATLGLTERIADKIGSLKKFEVFHLSGEKYQLENFPIMKAIRGIIVKKERMKIRDVEKNVDVFLDVDAFPIRDEMNVVIAGVASFTDVTMNIIVGRALDEANQKIMHLTKLIENSFFK